MTLEDRLRRFIVSDLLFDRPGVEVPNDADLFGQGLVDSLGLMRLVAHLEDTYRIRVTDEDLVPENFGSVGALARFVASRGSRGGESA
jgi:acyl carrier protein